MEENLDRNGRQLRRHLFFVEWPHLNFDSFQFRLRTFNDLNGRFGNLKIIGENLSDPLIGSAFDRSRTDFEFELVF